MRRTGSVPIRVMLSRFSTMLYSHSASCFASVRSAAFSWGDSMSPFSRTALVEPIMLVRGVRKSWEMLRRRFARSFSRSASRRSCSPCRTRVVRVQVMAETANIQRNVRG